MEKYQLLFFLFNVTFYLLELIFATINQWLSILYIERLINKSFYEETKKYFKFILALFKIIYKLKYLKIDVISSLLSID